MSNIAIAPSILSADFCNLERDLKAIANADLVHVDVMDHHFVPNLTLGEPIVGRICQVTDLPVDVHLMIEDPDRWAPEYAKLGAASVSFHMGATHAPVRLARQLREELAEKRNPQAAKDDDDEVVGGEDTEAQDDTKE